MTEIPDGATKGDENRVDLLRRARRDPFMMLNLQFLTFT